MTNEDEKTIQLSRDEEILGGQSQFNLLEVEAANFKLGGAFLWQCISLLQFELQVG